MHTPINASDRLKSAIRSIVAELFPWLAFCGVYEYTVVSCDGTKVEAKPADPSIGLPDITCPLRPSILCETSKLAEGASITIAFINHDRGRPFVIGGDPSSIPEEAMVDASTLLELAATATACKLGEGSSTITIGGGVLGAARMTDPVLAGPFAGTITAGSTKTLIG